MKCNSCGHINAEYSNFCVVCGSNLSYSKANIENELVNDKSGLATASMILGIISAVFGVVCCLGYISVAFSIGCGVMAIIFSIISWKSSKQKYAIAGLVCGICGLILGIITLIIVINGEYIMEYWEDYIGENPYGTIIKSLLFK